MNKKLQILILFAALTCSIAQPRPKFAKAKNAKVAKEGAINIMITH
jgi:hypothetical protein